MQMLRKLENFQTFCFHWIFGCRLSYCEILKKHKTLPPSFHILLNPICMFVDIFLNNYIFNHRENVQIKRPPCENMRKRVLNPIKLLRDSTAEDSFFSRSANINNFLHRHSIVEISDTKIRSKGKNFLLTKLFNIQNMCTYFICCSCSKCKCTLSVI